MPPTNSYCEACGRRRPTYAVENEDGEVLFMCGSCIELRVVR